MNFVWKTDEGEAEGYMNPFETNGSEVAGWQELLKHAELNLKECKVQGDRRVSHQH